MNQLQTHLDPGAVDVPSLVACVDVFAAWKTQTNAAIASRVDADQATNAVDTHADQAFLCSPQPISIDVVQTGDVAGRISAATLAAAHRAGLFHAAAMPARAVQPLHA